MAVYALGDLHLHFSTVLPFDMEEMGKVWADHEHHAMENCHLLLNDDDVLVLCGDNSFARNLKDAEADFSFIRDLPGRKVVLRGNHDYYWDAKHTAKLNQHFGGDPFFLQDNFYPYGDIALVGTKGYCYEGKDTPEHAAMLVERECERLTRSFEAARAEGFTRFAVFLHYPPTNIFERSSPFTKLIEKQGAEHVVYAHCHGEKRFHDSILGRKHGIRYMLASGDFLRWHPLKVLD